MTIIRGKTGWIVVDPLLSEESAAAGWKLFADTVEAKSGKRPIKAVIFSHSHSDHFGGVGGVVTPEQVEAEKIRIIAPHGFSEEATRSEEHTSELQSLMRISYAVFCLKKKKKHNTLKS